MFYISCFIFCVFLSILLNCVKVCDCHTFNKRLLILFTYLVSFLHSYYINCIFGSFSLSSPLCVVQMLKYDTATQKYVTKPSVDCVCRIWRRQFGSKQKMGGSLLRQWSNIFRVPLSSYRPSTLQRRKNVQGKRLSSIFLLKASNFSCSSFCTCYTIVCMLNDWRIIIT